MTPSIPLIKVNVGKEELEAVKRVFDSGFLAQGPTTKKFEQEFAKYIQAKHASATTSCTTALQLAVASLGISKGDEVIVPSFTFPASANAVAREGAKPVFADVSLDTFNADPVSIEEKITDHTKAIMPIHLFGQAADMDAVNAIAKKHGLKVIEDAACAAGTRFKGKHVGTLGDFGCFSFHPRKILTTGEGGMITTNQDDLAEVAESLKDHGKAVEGEKIVFKRPGFNFRLSDILSAIGIEQLKKLDATIKRRQELAKKYSELLEDTEGIWTPKTTSYSNHTFQSYVLLLDKKGARDKIIKALAEKGIQSQIGTYAVHLQPAYSSQGWKSGDCPNSETAFADTLTLPLYTQMTNEEQDKVVKELKNALEEV